MADHSPPALIPHSPAMAPSLSQPHQHEPTPRSSTAHAQHHPEAASTGVSASPIRPSSAELLHQLHELQQELAAMGHGGPSAGHAGAAQGSSSMQLPAGQASMGASSCTAHPAASTTAHTQALLHSAQPGQGSPIAGTSPHAGAMAMQAHHSSPRSDSGMHQASALSHWPAPSGAQPHTAAFGSISGHMSAHGSIAAAAGRQTLGSHSADDPAMPAVPDARTAGAHGSSTAAGSCPSRSMQHGLQPVPVRHVDYAADPDYAITSVPLELLHQSRSPASPPAQVPAAPHWDAASCGAEPQQEAALRQMAGWDGATAEAGLAGAAAAAASWLQPGAGRGSYSNAHGVCAAPGSPQRQALVQAVMAWQDAAAQAAATSCFSPPAATNPDFAGMQGAGAGRQCGSLPVLNMPQQLLGQDLLSRMAPVSAQQPVAATQYAPHGLASFGTAATGPGLASTGAFGYPAQPLSWQQQQQQAMPWQQHAAVPACKHAHPPLNAPAQGHHEAVVAAQQQLEHLLRLQQLHMLQMQVQLQAMVGAGHLPFAAGLQPGPQLPALWGLGALPPSPLPGMLHPALQLQQQLAASAAARAAEHTQQPGQVPAGAATAASPPTGPVLDPVAGVASGMPCPERPWVCSSPFQAVQQQQQRSTDAAHKGSTGQDGHATALADEDASTAAEAHRSLPAAICRWMVLPRRSTAHKAPHHPASSTTTASHRLSDVGSISLACVGDNKASAAIMAAPSIILQCALYPVTAPLAAAYGASHLALHIVMAVGRTAAAASAWSVHSTALMCVTISQYQLLALLCCLAAAAAAAQAAGSAAAAAVDSGRLVLQLAGREGKLFGRAAAVVAFSDVRKLCRLLATQPLLPRGHGLEGTFSGPGAVHAAQARTSSPQGLQEPSPAAAEHGAASQVTEGGAGSHSLSRGWSSLLRGVFGVSAAGQQPAEGSRGSLHVTPGPSVGGSRRSSGQWALGPTEQSRASAAASAGAALLAAVGLTPAAGSRRTSQDLVVQSSSIPRAGGVVAGLGSQPVAGVSARSLVVYDSLAVVSGLWAGLWFRLWLLLALQGPAAGCRIWLHALKTGCAMSAAAACTAAQTALQVTWHLTHLSLAVLGTAKAADAAQAAASTTQSPTCDTSGTASGDFQPQATLPRLLGMLQWALAQLRIPLGSLGGCLAAAVSAAGPKGKALVQLLGSCWACASSVLAAAAAAVRSVQLWMRQTHQAHGLAGLSGKGALQQAGMHTLWLAGQVAAWAVSCVAVRLESSAAYAAEWVLRDVPPVGRAALYGSAGMIKGLVVEASRQSALLAGQLFEAWKGHE